VTAPGRCVYIVVSAAPPVLRIDDLVNVLRDYQWQVCIIATPTAATWINLDDIAQATGCVTRVMARGPKEPDPLPVADVVVAAPLTFNTLNKWATGISDTLALGILNEMLGLDVPVIAAPCIKDTLRSHPAYSDSVGRLRKAGVTVIDPDSITTRDDDGLAAFDWLPILQEIRRLDEQRGSGATELPT
jgi:phosphopantothenoylcysteine decarboxylase